MADRFNFATIPTDFRRTTLSASGRRMVCALAEAFFPHGPVDGWDGAKLERFTDEVDRYISASSKTMRFGLVCMLLALRFSPVLALRLRTLDELPLDERIRHLQRLERSRLTLILIAYKTVLTLLFYDGDAELARIGYPGLERHRHKRVLPTVERAP